MHDSFTRQAHISTPDNLCSLLATHLGAAGTLEDNALCSADRCLNGVGVVAAAGSCQAVLLARPLPARAAPQHLGAITLHRGRWQGRVEPAQRAKCSCQHTVQPDLVLPTAVLP